MLLRFKWKDVAVHSKVIYWMRWQSSQSHMQPTMAALLYVSLCISYTQPPERKTLTLTFIYLLYPLCQPWKLHLVPIDKNTQNICRLEQRPSLQIFKSLQIFIPAACTTRCPLVSSPLPSDSPAVAGCFAWAHGCSRKLWTGCLLCSRRRHTVGRRWF